MKSPWQAHAAHLGTAWNRLKTTSRAELYLQLCPSPSGTLPDFNPTDNDWSGIHHMKISAIRSQALASFSWEAARAQGPETGSYDHTMRTKSFLAIFISGIISGTHSFRRLIVGYKIEEIIGTGRSPPERSSGPSLGTRLWPKSTVISIQFLASSSSLPSCSATIWLAREALWKIVPHLLGPRKIVIAPYHIKRVVGSTFTRVANSVSISCQPEDLQGQSHFGMCSRIHCAPVERVRCDGGHARRRIVRKLAGHGY